MSCLRPVAIQVAGQEYTKKAPIMRIKGYSDSDVECLARLRTRTSAAAKISFGACNLQNGYKWIDKWNLSCQPNRV